MNFHVTWLFEYVKMMEREFCCEEDAVVSRFVSEERKVKGVRETSSEHKGRKTMNLIGAMVHLAYSIFGSTFISY